ncbi:MAG: hypothetical protein ACK45K_00150 [Burkholderiaceae bacterium]
MNKPLIALALLMACSASFAKLPPLSDEAKAKAEETTAKAAHTAKADAYDLCRAQDRVAAHVNKHNKAKAGKPVATAPCADPGKFVYTPAPVIATTAAASVPAATAPAAPAAPTAAAPATPAAPTANPPAKK